MKSSANFALATSLVFVSLLVSLFALPTGYTYDEICPGCMQHACNAASSNYISIELYYSDDCELSSNTVTHSDYGIILSFNCDYNTIVFNVSLDNSVYDLYACMQNCNEKKQCVNDGILK